MSQAAQSQNISYPVDPDYLVRGPKELWAEWTTSG